MDIVNDILDFSKIESGKLVLNPRSFQLMESFEDTMSLLVPAAHEKQLELVLLVYRDVPNRLVGDASRIRQILINLVGNAVKFTDEGEVVIRVMLEEEDKESCTIRINVTDSGAGINPESRDKLFSAFAQGDLATRREYGGTGLGLAICRSLVQAMGGKIGVEGAEGQGSTFWVQLTLPKVAGREQSSPLADLVPKRVLLCDEHRLSALAVMHRLQAWGMEVDLCPHKEQLLERLKTSERMPGLLLLGFSARTCHQGGAEKLITQIKHLRVTPILCLASSSDTVVLERLRGAGADVSLSKPVSGKSLYDSLRKLQGSPVPDAGEPGRKSALSLKLSGRYFLVADDNPMNQKLLTSILEKAGAGVTTADDGLQAVELVKNFSFDLLFMDVHMPGLSGPDAARLIRENEVPGSHLPIIALTADVVPETRERIFQAGMDDCLIKPILEDDLWGAVRIQLDQQAANTLSDTASVRSIQAELAETGSLPMRDRELALSITGGDDRLADRMFGLLLRQLPEDLQRLDQWCREEDWEALRTGAHKLHGSTMYCGVPALNRTVHNLELASRSRDTKMIERALEVLHREVDRLMAAGEEVVARGQRRAP